MFVCPPALLHSRAKKHADAIARSIDQLLKAAEEEDSAGWEFYKQVGATVIAEKSSCCMRGITTVGGAQRRVQMVVEDVANLGLYSDVCAEARVVEQLCDDYEQEIGVLVGYMAARSGSMLVSDRDYVFLQCSFSHEEHKGVVRFSIAHDDAPEVSGYTRGHILLSGFLMSPHTTSTDTLTQVTHVFSQELGGLGSVVLPSQQRECTEQQICVINSIRARFQNQSKGSLSRLTSRTKNLFADREDGLVLKDVTLDEAVLNSWIIDLKAAADKAGASCDGWAPAGEEDGVRVESKQFGESVLCVRAQTTVLASANQVFELVNDVTQTAQYDDAHVAGRVVRNLSHQGAMSMTVNWSAFAFSQSFALFSDRDFCYLQVGQQSSDGQFVVLCRSVEDDDVPVKSGFVRGIIHTSGFVISPVSSGKCELCYVCALDLKGLIPQFIADRLVVQLPLKVATIASYFKGKPRQYVPPSKIDTSSAALKTPTGSPAEAYEPYVPPKGLSAVTPPSSTASTPKSPKSPMVPGLDLKRIRK